MRSWLVERVAVLFEHRLFRLERRSLAAGADRREALVLDAPDWTNVVALLPDQRVVLVRQWRFGVQAPTLEVPGGMLDPGEDARQAAERELLEETGYRAGYWQCLGSVQPNPAFLSNACTTWLARDLVLVGDPQGDGEEEIAVETVPLAAIPGLIADGEIRHSLVISAFHLLALRMRTAIAIAALSSLAWACSGGEPATQEAEPKAVPTEDVALPLGAGVSIAGDRQERVRRKSFSGVLPGDFPNDVPVYEPSTLTDFGQAAAGVNYVIFQTPDPLASVRARFLEQLEARGYRDGGVGGDGVTLVQGERKLRVTFEDARPGTRIRVEYQLSP